MLDEILVLAGGPRREACQRGIATCYMEWGLTSCNEIVLNDTPLYMHITYTHTHNGILMHGHDKTREDTREATPSSRCANNELSLTRGK